MLYDELVIKTIDEELDPNEGAILMVRTPDGKMFTVKKAEIERHDPEESMGGVTVWLDVEEY